MTIAGMGELFDILQDKYGSPYYTNAEKSLFLNRAQIEFVNAFLPPSGEGLNIELSEDAAQQIDTLIYDLPYLNMNSSGIITKAAVAAALSTASGGGLLWRRLNIGWVLGNKTVPVKYVRHNDWYEFKSNYFKNPSTDNPKFYETATNYQFAPIYPNAKLYLTVLKYPKVVDIDTAVDSDLPDFTHNKIVALALEFAGIGSRDQNLAQLLSLKTGK